MLLTASDCLGISSARRERIAGPLPPPDSASLRRTKPGSPRTLSRGGVRVLITGPRGFERTVAIALDEAPKRIVRSAARRRRICRAEEALGGCPESQGGGDARAGEGRKGRSAASAGGARLIAATKRRWAALREAKAAAKTAGSRPGLGARRPDRCRREFNPGGRAAESGWPGEGGGEAAGRGEGVGQEGCGPAMAEAPGAGAPAATTE
jgi:hypothetical protein